MTNGPTVHTSGVDVAASYTLEDVLGGALSFGANAGFVLEYEQDQFNYRGFRCLTPTTPALEL